MSSLAPISAVGGKKVTFAPYVRVVGSPGAPTVHAAFADCRKDGKRENRMTGVRLLLLLFCLIALFALIVRVVRAMLLLEVDSQLAETDFGNQRFR
jgi:hypothetical protein